MAGNFLWSGRLTDPQARAWGHIWCLEEGLDVRGYLEKLLRHLQHCSVFLIYTWKVSKGSAGVKGGRKVLSGLPGK